VCVKSDLASLFAISNHSSWIFRFSGITCEMLTGVTTSLKEIQVRYLVLFSSFFWPA
jgi:hypothetical protein